MAYDTPYSNTPNDIIEVSDGYVICGVSDVYGSPEQDLFLMKIDFGGVQEWYRVVDSVNIEHYNTIEGYSDGFFVAGRSWGLKTENILSKYDLNGNLIWHKYPSDTAVLAYDCNPQELLLTDSGLLIATSHFDTSSSTTNGQLIMTDLDGNEIWQKSFGSDSTEDRIDVLSKVVEIDDGLLLIMESENQIQDEFFYLIRTDINGNELWRKEMNSFSSNFVQDDSLRFFFDANVNSNDEIVAVYCTFNSTDYNTTVNLFYFDESGQEFDYVELDPIEPVSKCRINFNSFDEIYLIGQQELDTAKSLYSQLFAAKILEDNSLLWVSNFGNKDTNEIQFSGIVTSDSGVLIGGRILNTTAPPYGFNSVLVKTDCTGNLIWNYSSCIGQGVDQISIFPNPFTNELIVQVPNLLPDDELKIEIYNLSGQLVLKEKYWNSSVLKINTFRMSNGFYVLKVYINNDVLKQQKLIKV